MEDMFKVLCIKEKEAMVLARYFTSDERHHRTIQKIHAKGGNSWQEVLRLGRVKALDKLSNLDLVSNMLVDSVRGDAQAQGVVFRLMDRMLEQLVIQAGRAERERKSFKLKKRRPMVLASPEQHFRARNLALSRLSTQTENPGTPSL